MQRVICLENNLVGKSEKESTQVCEADGSDSLRRRFPHHRKLCNHSILSKDCFAECGWTKHPSRMRLAVSCWARKKGRHLPQLEITEILEAISF